ncbi:synaptotagmin-8, partial [Balaenoptera musculus]|uniref:Synaptotagmin-8 n=1 Tax=Balaenoptera musculus TaxID=9771 RepID=A0A8B8Y4Q7_BALMU
PGCPGRLLQASRVRRRGAPRPPQRPGPGGLHGCTRAHSGPGRPDPLAPLGAHSHCGRGWVVAGVLVVSCLLCAIGCCRGRHRKKPRDEEAVGLGSACSTINTHLVQPDVDNVEPGPGGPQQWERLQPSVEYDVGSQAIKVGLKQAARRTPTPASASPLRPGAGTRRRCTVVPSAPRLRRPAPSTSPPWSCPGPPRGCRCPSQHEPLGVLSLPLGTVDLQPTSPGALAPSGPAQRCRGVPADHWAPVPPCPVCPAGKLRPFLLPAARAVGGGVLLALVRALLGPADRGRAGGPRPEPGSGRALREGPACAEPEEVEEEEDICQEGHGHPLLQRGLHLPCAFQPDPGGLPGGGG